MRYLGEDVDLDIDELLGGHGGGGGVFVVMCNVDGCHVQVLASRRQSVSQYSSRPELDQRGGHGNLLDVSQYVTWIPDRPGCTRLVPPYCRLNKGNGGISYIISKVPSVVDGILKKNPEMRGETIFVEQQQTVGGGVALRNSLACEPACLPHWTR